MQARKPKWDDGQTVFEGVLKEMDDAEAALVSSDLFDMTDPLLGGSLNKWKQYANVLRLRIYLRFIDAGIDASGYTAKAQAIVAGGNLPTEDVAFDVYSNAEGQYNPWYSTNQMELNGFNFCAAYPLVAYYQNTNDPRISYAIAPAEATSSYVGQLPGSKTLYKGWNGGTNFYNKDFSAIKSTPAAAMPIYLSTVSEVEFLKAEVELRFNHNTSAAKTAYEAGVTADFNSRGIDGVSAFLAGSRVNFDAQGSETEKLNLIYKQKWVAFFYRNHFEAWSEQRRTDVPSLSSHSAEEIYNNPTVYTAGELVNPGLNYYGNNDLCKRMPYPSTARKLNSNTPSVKTLADPVFWDVK